MSDQKEMDDIKIENCDENDDGATSTTLGEPHHDEAQSGAEAAHETFSVLTTIKDEPVGDISIEDKAEVKIEPAEPLLVEIRGIKRRASDAFSDAVDDGFKGFGEAGQNVLGVTYQHVLDRIEAEVTAASQSFTPVKLITASVQPFKLHRQETDGSRPSSALSSRSDGDAISSTDASAASSPAHRGRRLMMEISSPMFRVPLERGWKRELVYRASFDNNARKNADIYYYTPAGKKLRSTREVSEHLSGTGLTLDNFSFFKEPLGVDDPEKEIIRDARAMGARAPTAAPVPVEGKRTPKPKPPKGASPELDTPKSPPAKIRVKSMGSRLSQSGTPATAKNKKPPVAAPIPPTTIATTPVQPPDNNNSAGWKKSKTAVTNGADALPDTPRRRTRGGKPEVLPNLDSFTSFYERAKAKNYDVVMQIFQYLGMRDLARCALVCRLWRQMASTPQLWRHVRMKNSHVSDWDGLCNALRRHATRRLDLRKMLLPQNDGVFWEQFANNISKVVTLERIELCRCPSSAVEAVCQVKGLRSLSAVAIRDLNFDPSPLANLPELHELRLKSMSGLSLTRDLNPLASLKKLQHLSLTSIKDLGCCVCEVVGELDQLESLELGECTFGASFAVAVRRLKRLRRLRLERGVAHCAAPALLRALPHLPLLTRLELVNVDVKLGFDDALAECKNIQRLLIIPTYVSQSATTNRQVLSGVLRLKDTLTHLMWGMTIELLRVTELFIDQCSKTGTARRELGECIPVLKPVPGAKLIEPSHHVNGPPQVEILPLPMLQRLLSVQLPNTKLKLLRIPFHATWRQSLADFH